jgi:hypothetical protein
MAIMKRLMENLTEKEKLVAVPEAFDFITAPAGYCPPEQAPARDPGSSRLARKFVLGLLLGATILAAKPATANENPVNADLSVTGAYQPYGIEDQAQPNPEQTTGPRATMASIHRPTLPAHREKSLAQADGQPIKHKHKLTARAATFKGQTIPEFVLGHKIQLVTPARVRPNNAATAGLHYGTQSNWVEIDSGPDGLYEAQFNQSDQAQVLATTKGEDLKGRTYSYLAVKVHRQGLKPFWECGWALSGAVTREKGDKAYAVSSNPCVKQIGRLASSFGIGHKFNCPPGKCNDGTYATHLTPQCNDILYRNDAALGAITAGKSLRYARSIKHPLYDPKQTVSHSKAVHYRFAPNEDKTVVVRSDEGGWSLMWGGCVDEDPKGGPPLITKK